jgi:serine/threonine protein kinase
MVEPAAQPGTESSWHLRPGEVLVPGYLAWSRLGGGEHCETWLAWSVGHWCPVAVKLPRPAEVRDPDTRADLALEARHLTKVGHPGVQRLVAERLEDPVPHLVLEYVEGPTLSSLLGAGALSTTDTVLLGLQVASALRCLHELRLVHLDVKPGNIVIREGRAVLLDLGIATVEGSAYPADDAPGTPGFMADELFRGGEITSRTDAFALAATLVQCLAPSADGVPGLGEDTSDSVPFAPSSPQVPAGVEPGLAVVLHSMLAREANERPDDDAVLRLLAEQLPPAHAGLWPAWAGQVLRSRLVTT